MNGVVLSVVCSYTYTYTYTYTVVRIVAGTTTNTLGGFVLNARPARYTMRAGRYGYVLNTSAPFELAAGATVEKELQLTPDPVVLKGLEVRARRSGLEPGRVAFSRRCATGNGYCFTEDSILKMGVKQASDIFQSVPGLSLVWGRDGRPRVSSLVGHRCLVIFFNHSLVPLQSSTTGRTQGFHMDVIDLKEVRGIEVYRSFAELPRELKEGLYIDFAWPTGRLGGCEFALIWTDIAW